MKPADLVLADGIVRTLDGAGTVAEAVAVRDGLVTAVGSTAEVQELVGPRTTVVDLRGRCVLPGFVDAHAHISMAVSELFAVQLKDSWPVEECCQRVAQWALAHPEFEVVRGGGWSDAIVPGRGPRKEDLDKVVHDRPVILSSLDYHSVWVNSKALAAAGITADTPDPEGGAIERVPGSNEPSGTLRENAAELFTKLAADFTPWQVEKGIEHYQTHIAAPLGVTAVCDASLGPGESPCAAYRGLAERGALKLWMRGALKLRPSDDVEAWLDGAIAERERSRSPLFGATAVKFFIDGVVEGRTAYLRDDYANEPGYRGVSLWEDEALAAAFAAVDAAGFQIHVHTIGDAATQQTLDALEAAAARGAVSEPDGAARAQGAAANVRGGAGERRPVSGRFSRPPVLTHLQLVTPRDVRRMAGLGVIAVINPYWFEIGEAHRVLETPYLGAERAGHEYPAKSLVDAGVMIGVGSDYPVTQPPAPLEAIQHGMERRAYGADGSALPTLWPEERLGLQEMLAAVTRGGAASMQMEDTIGSIEVGKSADLVVLERDLAACAPAEIPDVPIDITFFRGEAVFID